MNTHELKIWPVHYNNVKHGTKTFEIDRTNAEIALRVLNKERY